MKRSERSNSLRRSTLLGALLLLGCSTSSGRAAPPNAAVREILLAQLSAQQHPLAPVLRDASATRLEGNLGALELYRLDKSLPTRPVQLVVGYRAASSQGAARVAALTAQPEAWNAIIEGAGVKVSTPAEAVALARLFHQATRPTGKRHLLVESAAELPMRPNLGADEAKQRDEALAALRPLVQPLSATAAEGGFSVVGYEVDGMNVVRLTWRVTAGGAVTASGQPVRENLPLVYAN